VWQLRKGFGMQCLSEQMMEQQKKKKKKKKKKKMDIKDIKEMALGLYVVVVIDCYF
jgi:hypothetical protein